MFQVMFLKGAVPAVLAGLLALAGCQSSGGEGKQQATRATTQSAQAHDAHGGGMMCPKCETTWVRQDTPSGPRMSMSQMKKGMVCPDCNAMASAYLKDGEKVLHECNSCRVTPRTVDPTLPQSPKGSH